MDIPLGMMRFLFEQDLFFFWTQRDEDDQETVYFKDKKRKIGEEFLEMGDQISSDFTMCTTYGINRRAVCLPHLWGLCCFGR